MCISTEGFTSTVTINIETDQTGDKDKNLLPMPLRHWLETGSTCCNLSDHLCSFIFKKVIACLFLIMNLSTISLVS